MDKTVLGNTASSYSLGMSVPSGRMIFISGTVSLDEEGCVIGLGDMAAQARTVFAKIGELLQEAGASVADVVKITTFVTDMSQYDRFTEVRKEVFGDGPYPASSTVMVSELIHDDLLIEVEAIAVV